jgi:glutathione S-transferase
MAPHAALEEAGAKYELVLVDTKSGEHKKPEYLKLNPHGRVPTLAHGDFTMYESAAILMHIADFYPNSGLAPALGSAERGHYYQWLCYLTNTVQEAYLNYFHSDYYADAAPTQGEVKAVAERRLAGMFDKLEAALAGKTYLLGERFSGADIFLMMMCRWSRNMAKPAFSRPNLGRHYDRLRARPAVQRMMQQQGLS